jgi:predicted metal-dependent HD superfamily phosphohydrolase
MMEARWLNLMTKLGLDENKETYHQILEAYSGKERSYHSVSHLQSVLECLDSAANLAENKDEVELALWFHDAVYKPFSSSNEADSANWALDFLQRNGASKEIQNRTFELVMATAHDSSPTTTDEKLIVDIDLSVLGQPKSTYLRFSEGVRKEYLRVPSFLYRRKRKEVLSSFLNREKIYSFATFQKKYEYAARENIAIEIESL